MKQLIVKPTTRACTIYDHHHQSHHARGNSLSCRLLFRSAAAWSLLVSCAGAFAAAKNVDVVVAHNTGSLLTTYTVQETSGKNRPAGMVYIAGQSFRRGDLLPGTYPVFRDPTTHTLLVQQLDEIATRRENGDDGSIRHLVFSVQLPAIPANGTYTMEVVRRSGTYSATAKQTLTALAQAHDLKLHLTDVRNQNGTVRGSGSLTFDLNAAVSNTGRDAPRKCATGPVRDCWIVVGPPIDDVTHQPDPLLYVTCYLDLTTSARDQSSLGPVRHVCRVDNSWMNVAAGSRGNTGNPGPAGLTNDPQAISYRPQLLDGRSNLLDWSWLDATVNSSNNPITIGGDHAAGCLSATLTSNGNWRIPQSTGRSTWYYGMPVFYHTAGKPPTGMTNDSLYFVYPVGLGYTWHDPVQPNNDTNLIQLTNAPFLCANGGSPIFPTDQGAGEQTFSFRVWHTHWMSWYTVDQAGAENWTNGAARTVSSLYPAMSAAERLYWKETGTVPPLAEDVTPAGDPAPKNLPLEYNYEPLSRTVITGGSGVGDRPELGVVSEWAAEAFLLQSQKAWQNMRAVALSATSYPESSVVNEASGHIPAVNNGPPGSNHAGAARSYPALGAPQPGTYVLNGLFNSGVVNPLLNDPISGSQYGYITGSWGGGPRSYGNDHYPAFNNMMYTIFGDRHYLDALYLTGNRQISDIQPGPSPVGYRDYLLNGVHYYGLFSYCHASAAAIFGAGET